MSEPSTNPEPVVYQQRVVLRSVSPLIWRRLLVCSDSTIADFHRTLQVAFGWGDEHLHRFLIHGRMYGEDGLVDPRRVRLAALGLCLRERFLYEYDFIDGWQHDVRLEHILPLDSRWRYPVCIDGRRATPPEDCGGPWAFLELRQHYSVVTIADRLLALLSPLIADRHAVGEDRVGDADAEQCDEPGDHNAHHEAEELATLLRWLEDRSLRSPGCQSPPGAIRDDAGASGGMKLRVQVLLEPDDDAPDSDRQSSVVHEVASIERRDLTVDTLGLQLAEAKLLLQRVQEVLVDEQARGCLAEQIACPQCRRPRAHKDSKTIVMRTLFGTVRLSSPRWRHCACQSQPTRTFCPLAAALPERTTPELRYLESKFAGLVSYGQSARLLAETLPLGRPLHASAVRLHALATAERLESELGPEQPMLAEGCQRDWDALPRPDLPLTVGLDGGYVHSSQQRSRRDGWFEVIAGKSMPTEGAAKCFGFVQTYDTKPKRRLFEVLRSQGMQMNQQVTFFTDGGDDVRELPLYLNPQSEQYLDWFHLTMRITVMSQLAKGLRSRDHPSLAKTVLDELERLKWFLWHGNVYRALDTIDGLEFDLDVDAADPEQRKLLKAVTEFGTYIRANAASITNYGERYRNGETISSAFVESVVNQVISKRMVKKQQMRWTPRGAHLLLQVRTRVLNQELAGVFQRWYPAFVAPTESGKTQERAA